MGNQTKTEQNRNAYGFNFYKTEKSVKTIKRNRNQTKLQKFLYGLSFFKIEKP